MDSDGEEAFPILAAAKLFDVHALRRAIAAGADLHVEDEEGYTALHWLCNNKPHVYDERTVSQFTADRLACISALLEAGADVNKVGGHNEEYDGEDPCPPLLDALFVFQKNRTECEAITTMLLRAGADVRRGTDDGLSPLHIAAMWGLAFIIPALLAAGAEVGAIWHKPQIDDWGNHGDWDLLTPIGATINLMSGHRMSGSSRSREFAMLLRAGAKIPRHMELPQYLNAVAKAGGYERYERAHRTRLAAIFIPKFPRVPAEIIPTIVSFWADCGGH